MSLEIKKHRFRFTSPAYLKFIRQHRCLICGSTETQASHGVSKGRADGSDATCLPVCQPHHPQSTKSANEVLIKHGLDPEQEVRKLQAKFMRQNGFTPNPDQDFESWCVSVGLGKFSDESKRKNRRKFNYYQKPT